MRNKKIAIDSFYYNDTDCYSVGVIFENWKDDHALDIITSHVSNYEHYMPGQFYKKELPGILSILKQVDLNEFDTVIVDGYVWLHDKSNKIKPGLGAKLYEELFKEYSHITVVGVGKTLYGKPCNTYSEVFRGYSKTPLYITCSDISKTEKMATQVKKMYGRYKLPKLLKVLDNKTKELKHNMDDYDTKSQKQHCIKRSIKLNNHICRHKFNCAKFY